MTHPLLESIHRVHEGTSHRVKDEEKALLFREICAGRSPTRRELARRLGMRPTSVSEAVQELVEDGLVSESRARPKGRTGRPRAILAPRTGRFVAISLYVESRDLKAVLVNAAGEVIAEEARSVAPGVDNDGMARCIEELIACCRGRVPSGAELTGVALSLVGTVDAQRGCWVRIARWPGVRGLDLDALRDRLGLPFLLRRANDTELEYYLQCDPRPERTCALLLHWGFGIGSAVAFRGTPLTSTLGRFGEIGHTRAQGAAGGECLCGARGCLETVAALWALMPALREELGTVPEGEEELAPLLGDPRLLDLPELAAAMRAIREALVLLYSIFFPDLVLLSGPFTENGAVFEALGEDFRRALPDYARQAVTLAAVPGGMPGCRHGGASPLVREALRRSLRRRT